MLEELQHLATPQLTAQDSATLGINAVQLENRFRQIDPEYGNLVHGWLPLLAVSQHPTWHIAMPEAGAIHSINGRSAFDLCSHHSRAYGVRDRDVRVKTVSMMPPYISSKGSRHCALVSIPTPGLRPVSNFVVFSL